MNLDMNKKKILYIIGGVLGFFALAIGVCYGIVSLNASGKVFDQPEDVPVHEYGLLLGTSPITRHGAHNYYFDNRIKAAAELYKAGKVKKIIASGGDYSGKEKYGCNELEAMRDSLIAHNVPDSVIILDYEGLRTINSIVKVKEVMHIDSCIIISQKYHNQRAIWQSEHFGLKAVGYNAKPSPFWKNRVKNIFREFFARPKMFLDLWFGSKPEFSLGSGGTKDFIERHRDRLVGNFNGECIDTLIAEPYGKYTYVDPEYCGFFTWRVYTVKGSVKELIIGLTTGIHFVKEGDLDGDGKDEWGFVTEWPTSNWMGYHLYTNVNGEWMYMIEPTTIWIPHLEKDNDSGWYTTAEEIIQPSEKEGFIKVKYSGIREDCVGLMLIDTLYRIHPLPAIFEE